MPKLSVNNMFNLILLQLTILTSGFRIPHRIIHRRSYMQNPLNQNQNLTSSFPLAPLNDMTSLYGNDNDGKEFNTAFIPTGPSSLSQIDKTNLSANEKLAMSSKSATAIRYFELVEKLSPNELLQKFAETAPRNVQEATKSTIVSMLGSLPNYALDAAMITTSSKLANLLYQMQLTGYMFKSAGKI